MWPLKPLRIPPPGLSPLLFTLAALAGLPGAAPGQPPQPAPNPLQQQQQPPPPPADRVEQLRRVVETYPFTDDQLFYRGEELKKRVAALRTLGELRRGLLLSEWKLVDKLNEKLAQQDQLYLQILGNRFKDTVKFFLNPKNADPAVRMALANMIGEMGTSVRALTPADPAGFARQLTDDLVHLLKNDKSPDVRAAAAKALGKINADPKIAIEPLKQALTRDIPQVRRAASEGFLTWVKSVDDLSRAGIDAAVSARPEEEVELIQKVLPASSPGLRDADPEVRRRSLEIIQQICLAVPVQRPLSADNLRNPEYVAKTIADIPVFQSMWRPVFAQLREEKDLLAQTLEDANPRVRAMGLKTVQEIAFLRLRIVRWINSVPAPEPMGKGAWRAVPSPIRLASAQVVLPKPKEQKPGQVVLPKPKEQKPGTIDEPALTEAVRPSVKVVARGVNYPNPRVRLAAIEFLDFLEDAAAPATDVLLTALRDPDRFVRWAAARALGKISKVSPEVVVRGVTPLLGDPDLDVRIMASATLERYGSQAAPAVPALAKSLTELTDPEALVAMLNALRSVPGEAGQSAVPAIAGQLYNPVPRVRRVAAETLGSYGEYARPAERDLRRILNDDEPEVRQAASDAILAIAPQPPQK